MKIIRSKRPLTIGDRSKRQAVIAIVVNQYIWQEKLQRHLVEVEDMEVIDVETPEIGMPLKKYIPVSPKTVIRTMQQVDDLFNYFAIDIVQGDSFTGKLRDLIVKGLLLDTQQNPIYDSAPEDWEIIDTETETAPIPEA